MTPEGKTKIAVKMVLARFENLYSVWPVPTGYGPSTLDCLVCFHGRLIAIETKAPGKKLTPRQHLYKRQLEAAGATVFVIDGTAKTDTAEDLNNHLQTIGATHE